MSLLDQFFLADEETEKDLQAIRQPIQNLMRIYDLSGFEEKVNISVIKLFLRQCFEKQGFWLRFHQRRNHLLCHASHAQHSLQSDLPAGNES